jgi:hypothetical protein
MRGLCQRLKGKQGRFQVLSEACGFLGSLPSFHRIPIYGATGGCAIDCGHCHDLSNVSRVTILKLSAAIGATVRTNILETI